MWISPIGLPLEKILLTLSSAALNIAKAKLPPPFSALPLVDGLNDEERKTAEKNYPRLIQDCDTYAKVLLIEMVQRNPAKSLIATDPLGRRVALSTDILPRPARFKDLRAFGLPLLGNTKTQDGGSVNTLRVSWMLDEFKSGIWAEASWKQGIFEDEEAPMPFADRIGPEAVNSTVSLSRLRKWVEYLKAMAAAAEKCPMPERVPKAILRDVEHFLPLLDATLRTFEPIEGWKIIFEGSVEPQDYTTPLGVRYEMDESGELGALDEEKPKKGRKGIHIATRNAILAEFERRYSAGEFPLGAKQSWIVSLAQEFSSEKLNVKIGTTTAREIIMPVLSKILT